MTVLPIRNTTQAMVREVTHNHSKNLLKQNPFCTTTIVGEELQTHFYPMLGQPPDSTSTKIEHTTLMRILSALQFTVDMIHLPRGRILSRRGEEVSSRKLLMDNIKEFLQTKMSRKGLTDTLEIVKIISKLLLSSRKCRNLGICKLRSQSSSLPIRKVSSLLKLIFNFLRHQGVIA